MFKRVAAALMLVLILTACGGTAATSPTAVVEATDPPTAQVVTGGDTTTDEEADIAEETPAVDGTMTETETETETETAPAENDTAVDGTLTETDTTTTEQSTAGAVQRFVIVPEESQVQYQVEETFFRGGQRLATAVGVTQEIEGELMIDPANLQNSTIGTITIDISAFKSDSDRRDQAIRERWLESTNYPVATFEPTAVEGLPETYTEGEEISFQITGNLTVRETTRPVTFDVTGQMNGNQLSATATTNVQMTDFGFDPPDIAGVLTAENDVLITFNLTARQEA